MNLEELFLRLFFTFAFVHVVLVCYERWFGEQ